MHKAVRVLGTALTGLSKALWPLPPPLLPFAPEKTLALFCLPTPFLSIQDYSLRFILSKLFKISEDL